MAYDSKTMTLNLIRSVVCAYYGITQDEMNINTRKRIYAEPRQVYRYLACNLTKCSHQEIAYPFDHCSSINSNKVIPERMEFDKDLRKDIEIIKFKIKHINLKEFNTDIYNFINFRNVLIEKILKCQNEKEIEQLLNLTLKTEFNKD